MGFENNEVYGKLQIGSDKAVYELCKTCGSPRAPHLFPAAQKHDLASFLSHIPYKTLIITTSSVMWRGWSPVAGGIVFMRFDG